MIESDVTAVLTEVATQLTERGIRKSDEAAVREQKGGAADTLVMSARVDLEAARRIRDLAKIKAPAVQRRGGPRKQKDTTTPLYGTGSPTSSGIGAAPYSATA